MFGSLQLAFHESFVDHDFGSDIGQLAPLPRLHLLAHRFEVALQRVDTHRNAIDQGERLRVLRKHRCETRLEQCCSLEPPSVADVK